MAVAIQFLNKPKFALGAKALSSAQIKLSSVPGASSDAVILNVHPHKNSAGSGAQQKVGTSVFASLTKEISRITSGINDIDKALANAAQGTQNYDALTKEKQGLDEEYKNITGDKDSSGNSSAESSLVSYLAALGDAFSSGGDTSAILAQGKTLFGDDGIEFLRRGGADAVKQLTGALTSLTSDAQSLDDATVLKNVGETVTQLSSLFSGDVLAEPAAGESKTVLQTSGPSKPIEIQETSFEAAGQVAFGLRSAAPDDLIRAAASGLDPHLVNGLVLEPPKETQKEREKNARANEQTIQLTQDDAAGQETQSA